MKKILFIILNTFGWITVAILCMLCIMAIIGGDGNKGLLDLF